MILLPFSEGGVVAKDTSVLSFLAGVDTRCVPPPTSLLRAFIVKELLTDFRVLLFRDAGWEEGRRGVLVLLVGGRDRKLGS